MVLFLLDSGVQTVLSPFGFALVLFRKKMRPMKSFSHSFVRMMLSMHFVPACKLSSLLSQLVKIKMTHWWYIYTTRSVSVILPIGTAIDLMPYGSGVVAAPTGRSICLFLLMVMFNSSARRSLSP